MFDLSSEISFPLPEESTVVFLVVPDFWQQNSVVLLVQKCIYFIFILEEYVFEKWNSKFTVIFFQDFKDLIPLPTCYNSY